MTPVRLADGTELWTASGGEPGRPAAVFVHGGPGMWDYLEPLAALAEPWFRTHRYDQRGCGRSGPSTDHTLSRYVADLDELRSHLGYERWVVVGHSFGALLGLHYAAVHPQRVTALVHCSGVGLDWPTHRVAYRERAAARLTAEQVRWRDELERRDRSWDEEVEWRTLCWLPDFADPVTAIRHAAADAATPLPLNLDANRLLNAETATWSADAQRTLCTRVTVPVRIVHGAEDPRPVDGVVALAGALPDASLHVLPGAGHQPWRERPDLVRQVFAALAAGA